VRERKQRKLSTIPRTPRRREIQRAHADEDRIDYLLDVAGEIFLEKGFEGTSVGEIATRAKASKGTFYSRYPTKEKLFAAVFRRRADEAFQELASILLPDAQPEKVLRALGQWLIDCILGKDSINLMRLVYMEARKFPELGRTYYELGPRRGHKLVAEYFDELVARKVFGQMDTLLAAEQFFDILTGELVRRCALELLAPSRAERKKRLNAAVGMFLRAYKAR